MLKGGGGGLGSGINLNRQIISSLSSNVVLPRFNNAMARGRGSNGIGAKIAIIGDSTDVMGFTGGIPQGWGARLCNQLESSGVCNASFESGFVRAATAYTDSRMTVGSSWTPDAAITSIGGDTYKASTTTNAFVFRPSTPVDTMRIQYITQPGGGIISLSWSQNSSGVDLGTVSVSTDGAAGVGFLQLNIGSLQAPPCELRVKYVSGGQVNFVYMEAWDSTRQPVQFLAFGLGGSDSADWSDDTNAYSWLPAMVAHAPDVIILGSLVNDMGVTDLDPSLWASYVADSQTRMMEIIDAFRAAVPDIDVIIRTQNPQNPSATNPDPRRPIAYQDLYVSMVRGLASTYNGILVDVYNAVGSYAAGSSLPSNFYVDTWVHLSATGCSMIANQMSVPLTLSVGAGNGYTPSPFIDSINLGTDLKLRNTTILKVPASGGLALGLSAVPNGGTWSIGLGENTCNTGGGQSNVATGYNSLSTAGFKINNTTYGHETGLIITTGNNNTIIGNSVGSTTLTTGSRNLLVGVNSQVTTPASSTSDFINLGNTIRGNSERSTTAGLHIVGAESLLGSLMGANFNITTDNTIPLINSGVTVTISSSSTTTVTVASTTGVRAGMLLKQGTLSSVITSVTNSTTLVVADNLAWAAAAAVAGTKFMLTRIAVTNASISLTTAAGGVYTGTSKGGTAVVAASQVYSACTAASKVALLTLDAAGTADTFAQQNLYLNLTTPQGAAATADVYVYGIPMV